MPIRFNCKHCKSRLSITRKKSGNQVQCPHCYKYITVPLVKTGTNPSAKLESMDLGVVDLEPTKEKLVPPPPPAILAQEEDYELHPGPEDEDPRFDVVRIDDPQSNLASKPGIKLLIRSPLFWVLALGLLILGLGVGILLAPLLRQTQK